MANSSEWLGALGEAQATQPGWINMLGEPAEFRAALPFGAEPSAPLVTEPEPEPAAPQVDALTLAFAEGQAAGRAAALAEAQAEAQAELGRQRALRLAFRTLDEAAMAVLSDDLAETVIALCDSALAGFATDKDALLARCEAAARRIGGAATALRLHLHPDDIATLDEGAVTGLNVTPDPTVARGALLIEGGDGVISDGPAEWRRAIATAVRG